MNKPFIICKPYSTKCNLYLPYNHLWNAEDCCHSIATFADKLNAIGYDVLAYKQVSHFNEDDDNLSSWVTLAIRQDEDNLQFIPNLLANVRKLTIEHPGHSWMPFAKRQLEQIVL